MSGVNMKKTFRRMRRALAAKVLPAVIAGMIRALGSTLKVVVDDPDGLVEKGLGKPVIWLFWHNRLMVMPVIFKKYFPERQGAVLTSPSGDGEIIAAVMKKFGVDSVRGSSNKRGAAALREMAALLKNGGDLVITPDGPRGPRYRLGAGALHVAGVTGAELLPFKVDYEQFWELKTWDGFRIPKPFSAATVRVGPLMPIERIRESESFEAKRCEVEERLGGE